MVENVVWKLAVSGRMDLVVDMATYVKKAMRPNNFGMPFSFLSLSWIILIRFNPTVRRFVYSEISWEDCEGMLCSSPLGEAGVAASRLTPVGFYALLEWLTWWILPRWWAPSPGKGLELSYLASIYCAEPGSSVMLLGATWVSDPGDRSWGPGSSDSSCQASLGRGMIEYSLRCHYFARVKFYCIEISEWSSTSFSNFLGLFPSSSAPQWRKFCQIPHGNGGKHAQLWCLILGPLTLCKIRSGQGILRFLPLVTI